MRKVIINVCITGMVPTKEMTPYIPISVKEIAQTAIECAQLGASVVHVHPRMPDGKPTWKKTEFAKIIEGIRNENDKLIISATTSGRLWNEFEKRSEVLDLEKDLRPDLASLTIGSMNFISIESVNTPQMIEQLAIKMKEKGIKPELEIFELGMIHKAKYLINKGIIDNEAPYFNLLFGSLGTTPFDPVSFGAFNALLPENAIWSTAGVGAFQLDANVASLAFGGHVRVGLEDNIYFDREKKELASNQKLVERIANIIKAMGLEIATPEEAREILQLK